MWIAAAQSFGGARCVDFAADGSKRLIELSRCRCQASGSDGIKDHPLKHLAIEVAHAVRSGAEVTLVGASLDLVAQRRESGTCAIQPHPSLSGNGVPVDNGERSDAKHWPDAGRHRCLFDIGDRKPVVRFVESLESDAAHHYRYRHERNGDNHCESSRRW